MLVMILENRLQLNCYFYFKLQSYYVTLLTHLWHYYYYYKLYSLFCMRMVIQACDSVRLWHITGWLTDSHQ